MATDRALPLTALFVAAVSISACAAEGEEADEQASGVRGETAVCATAEGREQSALSGLAVGEGSAPLEGLVLRPFTTDGCSVVPDGVPGAPSKWRACCVLHDVDYWMGGTREDRARADEALGRCIERAGHANLGRVYEAGVRAMGSGASDQAYRWGYGWNGRRPYAPLTESDFAQAERLHRARTREALREQLAATPLVTPCDTHDPAFNGLRPEEITAYEHLRASGADVVEWARWGYFNLAESQLELKLASCARPVTFTFSRAGKLLDAPRCPTR